MNGTRAPGGLAEWRQHWTVVMPCFAGIMLVAAHGHALGVMIRPLEAEFGWPRAQISAGFMIISIMALLVGPLIGAAVDRWGPRRIALIGVPFYCAMLATLSLANANILSWIGLWVLVALGAMTILPVVWIAVLNGYFFQSRGLAMAIALSGTGMGAALYPMVVNALVDGLGWRMAYVAFAAICLVLVFPITFLFFREAPRARVAMPHAGDPALRTTARGQMASARFVKLAAASIVFSVASCALTNNLVPVLIGEGLTPASAAATAGLMGIGSITGRLVGGYLLDRLDGNKVAAVSVLLPILPAAILLATDHSQGWSAVACLVMGLSVGTELDACAYLAARHFGTRNFGALFGTINGLLLFGAGLAPLSANYIYDVTRSYDLVLMGLIPLFILTAILFLTLGSYRDLDPETGQPIGA
ncbi:MFS transporter [Novosphingobium album (ex Liu et al. 2023)]|uniref:MFS transporter n=1 Tax=Novosphingobium album (ex Liu et al. 2023) TaxID=3031130 RepID=A0ABT5WV66_9SPHN|nr:MFS transporter [Novosphingobium album (ex Liu et al. 2023)]MDE8653805.1 MFS transporter [Novosphingobium album (ex Liu et al. 2023)]